MTGKNRARAVSGALALLLFSTAAMRAEQSCTAWMDQGDGTSWTTCVGDDGKQRCYLISNTPGSTAYEVNCSS